MFNNDSIVDSWPQLQKPLVLSLAGLAALTPIYYYYQNHIHSGKKKLSASKSSSEFESPVIEPVDASFNWETAEPHPYRPFKYGDYKMTLAIRKQEAQEMFTIENSYKDRTKLRAKMFEQEKLYYCHPSAVPALKETYSFIFSTLTKRYPMYFVIENDKIINKINKVEIPLSPENLEIDEMLRLIATNIEEDFLILIKNLESEEIDEYYLRAAVSLFPAGFNPIEKIDLPLTQIHEPVPNYKEKLQFSMNKFFARLKVNEFIVRNNWSIQCHTNLCAPTGSHASETEAQNLPEFDPQELDYNKCFFRVEKQSFTRLPESKADLMTIRTYVTPLMQLRETLDAEETERLCSAIDGLNKKNQFDVYKRKIQWGTAAKAFLRRETDGAVKEHIPYKFVH
ncbi:hypothetical protein DAMA08_015250 [Martiniozyma asiatica (nom. inval.)]|nr:hypothetical protein DAMA08_015250 [Martiniozyma asiatica]